jgi:hypothetical protein
MIGTAADMPPWLTGTSVIAVFLFDRGDHDRRRSRKMA